MVTTGVLYPWPASPLDLSSLCADAYKDLDLQNPPVGSKRKHGSRNPGSEIDLERAIDRNKGRKAK